MLCSGLIELEVEFEYAVFRVPSGPTKVVFSNKDSLEAERNCIAIDCPAVCTASNETLSSVMFSRPSTPALPEGPVPRSPDPEFAVRLLAVAAMQPLLCVDWDGGDPRFEAGDDAIATVRRYLLLQAALARLGNALSADETEGRLPLWRHMFVESPRDAVAWEVRDQWLYGRDVMVVPVLSPRVSRRAAYFPVGTWVEVGRQERRREVRGPKRVLIDVPPGEIGLFERRGGRWGVRRYLSEDEPQGHRER